jgi:hypothetical protein
MCFVFLNVFSFEGFPLSENKIWCLSNYRKIFVQLICVVSLLISEIVLPLCDVISDGGDYS